jgi:hypothetical protein
MSRLGSWVISAVLLCTLTVPFASAANVTAEAGNVTRVTILLTTNQTRHWQGFSGRVFFGTNASAPSVLNATGGFVNGSDLFFQIDCDNPTSATGFVFLSNSSANPANLTAGNLTRLDSFVSGTDDRASNTFTTTSTFALTQGTVTSVPTVFSFVNETAQSSSFREGYFNQGHDLVFATVIGEDLLGYNRSFFDYQALVPAPNQSTVQYFIVGDITFTCPAAPAPAGGGGGGGRGGWPRAPPTIVTRPPARPLPDVPEIPRIERPEEIPLYINLSIDDESSPVREQRIMRGKIINRNPLDIGDVRVDIRIPEILQTFAPAHPRQMFLWNTFLSGWHDHGHAESEITQWAVSDLPHFDWIPAVSETPFTFLLTPPLMLPKTEDITGTAYSGEVSIATDTAAFDVQVPSFAVYAREKNPGVFALYYVVDNRGGKEKSINIEVMLNRGRSTLIAEMLGPLSVPEDRAVIFAHEYRLGSKAQSADIIAARLYGSGGAQYAEAKVK